MKKFTLSFLVIFTFGLYALFQKSSIISAPIVTNEKSTININGNQQIADSVPATSSIEPTNTTDSSFTDVPPIQQTTITIPTTTKPVIKPKLSNSFNDGTFTGASEDAYYDTLQVQAVISGGKLINVLFVHYPNDNGTSSRKSAFATPILKSEAIKSQNANVNTVSGATYTSEAFRKSLASALTLAKA